MKRFGLWLLLSLLLPLACGTSGRRDPDPARPPQQRLGGQAATSSGPVAPPARRSGTTTPGAVVCGEAQCDLATEVCCVSDATGGAPVARCVARGGANERGRETWVCGDDGLVLERSCDEQADCESGKRCCAPVYDEGHRKQESSDEHCGDEVCLPSSTCPNGNACKAARGESTGLCPLEVRPPRCGADRCAVGEVCCWHEDRREGFCAERCPEEEMASFACSGPADCAPPYACNTWPGAGRFRCGGSGFQGAVLCDDLGDCPKHLSALGYYDGAPVAVECAEDPAVPPGVKLCRYE